MPASTFSAYRRVEPRAEIVGGHADAQPLHRFAPAPWRSPARRNVRARSNPADRARRSPQSTAAASRTIAGKWTDAVERRSKGDQPIPRNAAISRHHARECRKRHPAGEWSRRCRCPAPPRPALPPPPPPSRRSILRARGRAPRDCAPARRRSFRSSRPWRTRRNWSCPARWRRPAPGARRRWRRRAGGNSRGCAKRRWWCTPRVLSTSLTASGNPASAGKLSPLRDMRVDAVGLRIGALGTKRQIRVQFRIALVDARVEFGSQFARGDALRRQRLAYRGDRPVLPVRLCVRHDSFSTNDSCNQ